MRMHYNFLKLTVFSVQTSADGNISSSLTTFTPRQQDDGKFVSCQATNTLIEDSGVEDQWKISVHCKFGQKRTKFLRFYILPRQASGSSLHGEQR